MSKVRDLYTDRVPDDLEAQDYDEYYTESNLEVPGFVEVRVRQIVAEFEQSRNTCRLLDIGFGAGTILEAAASNKWIVSGVEVSKPAVENARLKGFDIFHGSLKDAKYEQGSFDVVTASEIIEHLPDPEADLKEIARILRPGGLFWATTPHAQSLSFKILGRNWSVLSPPEHIQLYSRSGMRIMLEKAGFEKIALRTSGLNPYEIKNRFHSSRNENNEFNRVTTAYHLNEKLTNSWPRRQFKNLSNEILNLTRLGDSMRIHASTPSK